VVITLIYNNNHTNKLKPLTIFLQNSEQIIKKII
jgi:hypothetical protein